MPSNETKEQVNINVVVLDFGYVESTGLASVIAMCNRCFASEEEAIKDLALDLLAKYKECFMKDKPSSKACCLKARDADPENKFCPKCSRSLHNHFDVESFKDWIRSLPSFDLDSYGYDDYCDDRDLSWDVGVSATELIGRPASEIATVSYAEKSLLKVLDMKSEY